MIWIEVLISVVRWFGAAVMATTYIQTVRPDLPTEKAVQYGSCVASTVEAHRPHLSPELIVALVWKESRWVPTARSHTGDLGLGQLHCPGPFCEDPPTAQELATLLDPCSNLALVGELLKKKRYRLAMYNPGNPQYAHTISSTARWIRDRTWD